MNDLISRQAAIDELTKDKKELERIISGMGGHEKEFDHFVGQRNQVDCDISAIEQLPSAHRWIPVTERLPEPNEREDDVQKYYLIQNEFGDMMVAAYLRNTSGYTWWEQMYTYKPVEDKVIAWMPLPKRYERSEDAV